MSVPASVRVAVAAGLTPLDLVSGFIYGTRPGVPPLGRGQGGRSARGALEEAVLQALLRPPCVVSFSGGRDSSAMLALAAHVAAREGLQHPVPVTLRFPDDEGADEDDWQEAVIRHVGLQDWERVDLTDEVDIVGAYAQATLRAHGLLWPHNTHFHAPIAERARGGTVLTGIGGDELLLPPRWSRAQRVVRRQVRPVPRDVLDIAAAFGPRGLRRVVLRRDMTDALEWLEPAAEEVRLRVRVCATAVEPAGWDRWVREAWWRSRGRLTAETSLRKVVSQFGAAAVHPFEDAEFLQALAREMGPVGFGNRTQAMRTLFADLLPLGVLRRSSKASFNRSFSHRHSRAFAASWDGQGIDERWVNPGRLRIAWSRPVRDGRSALLMQALWLAGQS